MIRSKLIILALLIFFSVTSITSLVKAEKVSRKDIDVIYQYDQLADGFGNIRKVTISGYVKNSALRNASKVNISFKLIWSKRHSDRKKLHFLNIPVNQTKDFEFTIDLGTQPDTLQTIVCNIDRIKFARQREVSALTDHHLVLHDYYSLPRLNEEGKDFLRVIDHLRDKKQFRSPLKGEFETTDEFESRMNEAENDHFSFLMDELEKRYGQLLGGQNAVVRFLPRNYNNALVYLAECSAYFQVQLQLGRYNADFSRYENMSLKPRTFPFPPDTKLPDMDLQLLHKAGMFFLRKNQFKIQREEARIWREQQEYLILELTIRNGVIQDGPYLDDFCIIEKIQLKNQKTGRVFREWSINP